MVARERGLLGFNTSSDLYQVEVTFPESLASSCFFHGRLIHGWLLTCIPKWPYLSTLLTDCFLLTDPWGWKLLSLYIFWDAHTFSFWYPTYAIHISISTVFGLLKDTSASYFWNLTNQPVKRSLCNNHILLKINQKIQKEKTKIWIQYSSLLIILIR